MFEERRGAAPWGVLPAVVLGILVGLVIPLLVGDWGEAITWLISELMSPMGILIVVIGLLVATEFLSSDRGSFMTGVFNTGEPNSIHRLTGSPVGVGLFLVLLVFLLYYRVSVFRSSDDSDE